MKHTRKSLKLTQEISDEINNQTFHHHYYVLYDMAMSFPKERFINYVEIGCYAGGSCCLLLQRPNTRVITVDLGFPIPEEVVQENVNKLNKLSNPFHYIKRNSQAQETVNILKKITDSIDILFIDGDHSYQGVINDFTLYKELVKTGGYIVFDDYNDFQHSPQVKEAVNTIVDSYKKEYNVIGTLPNTFKARPESLKEGNVFILQVK